MSFLQQSDDAAAAVAVAPRVSLADIEGAVAARYDRTGMEFIGDAPIAGNPAILSICLLVMKNGFMVIGKSAPASAENFDSSLGKQLAYEDCIRQLWPLMGFALRDRMSAANSVPGGVESSPPDVPNGGGESA